MFKHVLLLLIAVVGLPGCSSSNANDQESTKVSKPLSFTMKALDGKDVDLGKYQGKVVLIVNVASKCGLTPQYEQLQALHDKYSEKGLAILGFPCNQFLWQEPGEGAHGTSGTIGKLDRLRPMFSKRIPSESLIA